MVTAFTLRKALRLRIVPFLWYLLPRSRLAESCVLSVGLFPPGWNGSFHSWRFRVSLSVVFAAGRFSPIQEPWVPGYLFSLALALLSYCLRHVQGVRLPLPLLFITPFASLVSSKTLASWVLTVSSAPDSERRSPLGRYPCSIFGLVSFYPSG